MSSSVFFRFKSQKEPSRVAFDGTGISVFELKREIIVMNKLGDGTDFELVISSEDSSEVFEDDTSIIPRSTTVIAKRLPPSKPGKGGAARYVSGKMPQNARTSHRSEVPATRSTLNAPASELILGNSAQTEEQKLAAVFKIGADQWAQQKQDMANATPVHRSNNNKGKSINIPDHPPPPGYVCYRCGEKGHWIQVCPTNDDPAYENRPRVKRTTGIPRSFLKTVDKPSALATDGLADDTRQPTGIMVNAEGEWVIAEPDKAAWDQYQSKAKISAAALEAAKQGSKDLQDRGLECSIDKHLFVDPTKTPCCQTTFCHDCIVNSLVENDLRCPECSTENILIDDLIPDVAMNARLQSFEEDKAATQAKRKNSKSPVNVRPDGAKSPLERDIRKTSSPSSSRASNGTSKKRPAESELVNPRIRSAPRKKSSEKTTTSTDRLDPQGQISAFIPNTHPSQESVFPSANSMTSQGTSTMAYPNVNTFPPMGMAMGPNMGMTSGFQDAMLMPNGYYTGSNWSLGQGSGLQGNHVPNGIYNQNNNFVNTTGTNGMNANHIGSNGRSAYGHGRGTFANQQRTTFSTPSTNDEDSAYFRKPVNPHRHPGRRNVQRPTDYREI
ncbi:Protein mpe1 [Lecanora helva]